MIGRTNAGGSGAGAFAFIVVTYPAGSTCTCTNSSGKKDISSTQRIFYIKKGTVPFDCVVTATDGTQTATKTVSITYEGQSESVSLSYSLYLYNQGTFGVTMITPTASQIGNSAWRVITPTRNESDVAISASKTPQTSHTFSVLATDATIDLSEYSKLKCKLNIFSGSTGKSRLAVIDGYTGISTTTVPACSYFTDGTLEYEVDLSSINESKHIYIGFSSYINREGETGSVSANMSIDSVWLEH